MVFQKNFVVVVKCGGKVLREREENTVYLPFGSEFALSLKNLNSRRASVLVSIDGTDILFGKSLILEPNSEVSLERFLRDNDQGNRFKFIQKTKEIADYRGDRIDDGLVRVEYRFEQAAPEVRVINDYHRRYHDWPWYPNPWQPYDPYWPRPWPKITYGGSVSGSLTSGPISGITGTQVLCNCSNTGPVAESALPAPEEGITVPGSVSNQGFRQGYIGALEANSEVITLRLRGYQADKGVQVEEPLTVKDKFKCATCGRFSKSSATFCANCGTAL